MAQLNKRILFCNLAYMINYDFAVDTDIPTRKEVSVGEQINFHDWGDGIYRGYVEIGFDNDQHYQICIENFDGVSKKINYITGVTVVFCARKNNATVVVGWYKNATVYRYAKEHQGYHYFFETSKDNQCLILPETDRAFEVKRATSQQVGFGEKNIWYAKRDGSQSVIDNTLNYIENY